MITNKKYSILFKRKEEIKNPSIGKFIKNAPQSKKADEISACIKSFLLWQHVSTLTLLQTYEPCFLQTNYHASYTLVKDTYH